MNNLEPMTMLYGLDPVAKAKLKEIMALAGESNPALWREAYCSEAEHLDNSANLGVFNALDNTGTSWECQEKSGDTMNGSWGPGWLTVGGYHCTMSTGPWAMYFAKQSTYGQFDKE